MRVGMNAFALRHTPESPHSHFEGTTSELLTLVNAFFEEGHHRVIEAGGDGESRVIAVTVPSGRFRSGVIRVDENTDLLSEFGARRKGEDPYIHNYARGEKAQAVVTEIICYSNTALAEDDDNTTDLPWEIVSINARDTMAPEPPSPVAWARNVLGLTGGTKRESTPEEIEAANMIMYWSVRASVKVE